MRCDNKMYSLSLTFLLIFCSLLGCAPSEPLEISAVAGNEQITIQWKTVERASSYNIYWSPVKGGSLDRRNKITGVSSPYSHGRLTKGIMYYYVVTAVNFWGESRASQEIAGSLLGDAPSEPKEVSITTGDKEITIQWRAVEGATSYNLYWFPNEAGISNKRNQIRGVSSPYTHAQLTNGAMYRYTVTAVNFYGESRASQEVADIPRSAPQKSRTRVVWVQDLGDGRDGDTLGSNLRLMGFDTGDGKGERAIQGTPGNYSKPLIAPGGDRVIYSDRKRKQVFVVNWDGSGLRELADGFGLAVWRDPRDGREWLYYGHEEMMEGGFHCRVVYRKTLDSPGREELVWDKAPVNIDSFQLSIDGRMAGGNFPWPEGGVAQLPNLSLKVYTKGCWAALATVNGKPFHWIFDGAHRNLTLVNVEKETKWQVKINGAPGIDGHAVYYPRWGNHPRVMALTGPQGVIVQTREAEVYVGRFNSDFTAIESWWRVTNNDRADYYPDVWVNPR